MKMPPLVTHMATSVLATWGQSLQRQPQLLPKGSLQVVAQLGPERSLSRTDLVASCQKDRDCQH